MTSKEFTSCINKYAGKTEPFLRWTLEHLEDEALSLALYDLDEEMYYYEQEYKCKLESPMERTMLKKEFYKRFGLKWSDVHLEDISCSNYS